MSILMAALSMGQSSAIAPNVGNAQVAASKIFETVDKQPKIDSLSKDGDRPNAIVGKIEFKGDRKCFGDNKQLCRI